MLKANTFHECYVKELSCHSKKTSSESKDKRLEVGSVTNVALSSAVIYLLDPIKYIQNLYIHRQFQNACKRHIVKVHLPACPLLPNPHYMYFPANATSSYCHVRHGSVLLLCVLQKLPWFPFRKTHQGKEMFLSIEYTSFYCCFLVKTAVFSRRILMCSDQLISIATV